MLLLLLYIAIGIAAVYYSALFTYLLYYHGKIPGPPSKYKILGNSSVVMTTPEKLFKVLRELGSTYPIYLIRILHLSSVAICSAEDAEVILSNPSHNDKSPVYWLLEDWLQKGLLTSAGDLWQRRRKILTPAFHFSILQQYVKTFNQETELLVKVLKDECDKPCIDINNNIVHFTLKTIAETAMGSRLTFTTQKEQKYKQAIIQLGEIVVFRLIHTWLAVKTIFLFTSLFRKQRELLKNLHQFTSEVITEREKNFKEIDIPTEEDTVYVGKKRLAMLDLLLMAKIKDQAIDDKGIQEEVDTFMFEGHDTTAVGLGFILMLLACHKNTQQQVYEEIAAVLGDIHKKPSYADLQNMSFLDRVLKECLRLYPSVPFISRILGSSLTTPSGYMLPKHTIIFLHIYDIHHNPKIYPDPEKFDPDRFLPENSKNRHPFAYLPFSAGSRNCIGQKFAMLELKAAVCGILANFVLEPVDTPETIVLICDLVLRSKEGIKIKFVPRIK